MSAYSNKYTGARGYLSACTFGLPSDKTCATVLDDLQRWQLGKQCASDYTPQINRARESAAKLLGAKASEIAIGSQLSVFVALVAATAPRGAEILCPLGEFSSVVAPFLARGDLLVRQVPLANLADEIREETWLVAYSLLQSATGELADELVINTAAMRYSTRKLIDTTQATGWLDTTKLQADMIFCHAYKWLSAPRGAAFGYFSERACREITPLTAGWYSGSDPWASCYGPELHPADDAHRFDLSPAWHAWAGAEVALTESAALNTAAVTTHNLSLANDFREKISLAPDNSAIVIWTDEDGKQLRRLHSAGIVASGRAGNARVSFHIWNDEEDVDLAARALA